MLHPEIAEICMRTDAGLWSAYARSVANKEDVPDAGRLVFPTYRNGTLRVSEQEARFAFVEAMRASELLYSVETPTTKRYSFTGKTALSAQTDLAMYGGDGIRVCNVEFKAKGVSPSAKKHLPIYKDIEKLMREPEWGLWFHLLEAVDNSTIGHLLSVIADQMERVTQQHAEDLETPGLTIHVCVLQHGFSIHREFVAQETSGLSAGGLREALGIRIKVSPSELLEVLDDNGWRVFLREGPPAN